MAESNSINRTPVRMEPLTPAVILKTSVGKVTPAKPPGTATWKVTPERSRLGDNGNTGAAKAVTLQGKGNPEADNGEDDSKRML